MGMMMGMKMGIGMGLGMGLGTGRTMMGMAVMVAGVVVVEMGGRGAVGRWWHCHPSRAAAVAAAAVVMVMRRAGHLAIQCLR